MWISFNTTGQSQSTVIMAENPDEFDGAGNEMSAAQTNMDGLYVGLLLKSMLRSVISSGMLLMIIMFLLFGSIFIYKKCLKKNPQYVDDIFEYQYPENGNIDSDEDSDWDYDFDIEIETN